MLVLAHEEVEDPEAKDLRHLRRNSSRRVMRKENADGTSPVSNAHASLSSIFDMTAAAPGPSAATRDPRRSRPFPRRLHRRPGELRRAARGPRDHRRGRGVRGGG